MKVLSVASEAFGLCKTGGLADVVTGLTAAQRRKGADVRVLLPCYRGVAKAAGARLDTELGDPLGFGSTRLLRGTIPATDIPVLLVDCPALYDREGGPYEHPDDEQRFGLLGRVAAMIGLGFGGATWRPDVVHAHDWQAGLAPAYLEWWGGQRPRTVITIHNLHFRGRFAASVVSSLAIPPGAFSVEGIEFNGDVSFLKAGLYYADAITTVSPSYAQEIQTEIGGEGLHGLLSSRASDLVGIVNGIDDEAWDPATDQHIAARYDATSIAIKQRNKIALQDAAGLIADPDAPLLGSVGRLSWQKGIDLLLGALPNWLGLHGQLCVLGSGDGALQNALQAAASTNAGRVAFLEGYDEPLSHRIIAGSDFFAVPSRFEPCGLTQLYAMRYGTPPIVRRTGGLADTVPEDAGFVFNAASPHAIAASLELANATYRDPGRLVAMQQRGMALNSSWDGPARQYLDIYAAIPTMTT